MIKDFLEVRSAEGMPKFADSTIALDFLLETKNEVRNCAFSLSESVTPEVRQIFINQLGKALNLYEEISTFMIDKGWLYPYKLEEQIHLDIESSNIALMIANLDLFPGNTNRLGMFATPEK